MDANSGAPGSNIMRGGPGTDDPIRITFPSVTMRRLLWAAYDVDLDQIKGPEWLDSERYSVVANVPPGATKEQLKLMLQSLVVARFHVKLHRESKETRGYELVIAKGGPKVRESAEGVPVPLPPLQPDQPLQLDANGFPKAAPGRYATSVDAGVVKLGFNQFLISNLPSVLGLPLGEFTGNRIAVATVSDKTGLAGKYDFTLEFAGHMEPGGAFPSSTQNDLATSGVPNLFAALETQLGLRLVETKVKHDMIVIDAIDKMPEEN